MKLSLISFTAIPYKSAESIHITMLSKALSKHSEFTLISSFKLWRPKTFSKNLKFYGLPKNPFTLIKFLQLYPTNYYFFKKIIKKNQNMIFYCRQGTISSICISNNRKCIWEQHALPSEAEFNLLKKIIVEPNFIGLVVITKSLKIDILKVIGEKYHNRIFILPDGADIDKFNFRKNLDKKQKTIGYIGSDYPGKGFEIINELIKHNSFKFDIYGVEKKINPFKNVVFHGRVPYSKIPDCLNSFDIGLLPNQPSVIMANGDDIGSYTSPMKMFEYMAAGKVIIASDIPVIREVLKNDYNAILVPHDNIEAWINAIKILVSDSGVFNRLKKQAYQDVCENYSYDARAKKIIQIINSRVN